MITFEVNSYQASLWIVYVYFCFANKGLSSQSYGFSSGHVWM